MIAEKTVRLDMVFEASADDEFPCQILTGTY